MADGKQKFTVTITGEVDRETYPSRQPIPAQVSKAIGLTEDPAIEFKSFTVQVHTPRQRNASGQSQPPT